MLAKETQDVTRQRREALHADPAARKQKPDPRLREGPGLHEHGRSTAVRMPRPACLARQSCWGQGDPRPWEETLGDVACVQEAQEARANAIGPEAKETAIPHSPRHTWLLLSRFRQVCDTGVRAHQHIAGVKRAFQKKLLRF